MLDPIVLLVREAQNVLEQDYAGKDIFHACSQ